MKKWSPYFLLSILMAPFFVSAESSEEEPNIRLESSFIGDKEQPSVSYFIPWEEIGTPDKLRWKIGSSYDETLSVVDRPIFIRSITVYQEMNLENQKSQ
ncbi:hypothetical protein [Marinibactrum halimedae]|uniref:Uncharacterized protein n=1 Tax=Marinibactrum halimedae TaxID=1444977 RepID=A0AA37T629_9GAMM|nr:hypothetical protein [Marinibactrum halimedae]MCD9457433.1 hypothetical protein [Marinibactrum halimedae]GLS25517.1 hypothetical protein GCM10007877_12310 [Marinibactrum halimedae]